MNESLKPVESHGLTRTQELLTDPKTSSLRKYKRMVLGADAGWGRLAAYEVIFGCLACFPGALGYLLRRIFYRPLFGHLDRGAAIGRNVTIRHPQRIRLGRGAVIDENVLLDARDGEIVIGDRTIISRNAIISTRGGRIVIGANGSIGSSARLATLTELEIGEYTLVAANCYIGGGNHRHDRLDIPIISQGMEEQRGVAIGRGAWLGAGAMVMDGARIGDDAIIGAAALVMADIPARSVVVGQPARVVRSRDGA